MALLEKQRTSLFTKLIPVIGEEDAQALLAQFPAREVDEPATHAAVAVAKAELHVEIEAVRTEIESVRTEIESVRTEIATVRTEIQSVRTEIATVRTEIESVRTEITGVKVEIAAVRVEIETVRTEFAKSTNRTIIWLSGVMVAVGALMTSAAGVLVTIAR